MGEPFRRGDLKKASEDLEGIIRAEELADGYVLIRKLLGEEYWVATVHGRMRCDDPHARKDTIDEVVAACRTATELARSSVPWPQTRQVPLTPVQLDVCARLHVVMSSCGFAFGGEGYQQFKKRLDVQPIAIEQARKECAAQARESSEWPAFGQPPVPLIPVADVVAIEDARKRGCEDVVDVYLDRTGNVVATSP